MRNERQHDLDRTVIRALLQMGDLPLRDAYLVDAVRRAAEPAALLSEAEEAVRYAEAQRRIVGIRAETGVKWKLTDAGRAWAAEYSLA